MDIAERDKETIEFLLKHEHEQVASQLKFINYAPAEISDELLNRVVELIDRFSRLGNEVANKVAVTLCAILWTYKKNEWGGLKDFLLVVLSRMGFSPSTLMIDTDYDSEMNKFSSVSSLFDQFAITCYHLKYEVVIAKRSFLLTEFQKEIWSKIEKCSLLGISAPTSAGKSFVLLLKSIEMLLKKSGNIVYIVPTLSLVFQVSLDFRHLLRSFGMDDYEILSSFYERPETGMAIYVLTQEKAIAAFSQQEYPFTNLRLLIVDEIQNLERVADENELRAKILYDTLVEFRHKCQPDRTIISGPRIEGIGNLGTTIFGFPSQEVQTKSSPVVNFTYAVSKIGGSYHLKQYTDIKTQPTSLPIAYCSVIDGHGGVKYTQKYYKYLFYIVNKLGPSSTNIIFSPHSSQARKIAVKLAEMMEEDFNQSDIKSLINYLARTVHPKYDLCHTLSKGIAYHHGKTPPHVRRAIEKAIRKNIIRNVVCTTTLMQGVNLPAQTVILRNPNLYVLPYANAAKLTNYEIANLRGRAGRLLQDFIGRTFALDENSFEDTTAQEELFGESRKELHPGYRDKFVENKELILSDLSESAPPSSDNKGYSFLLIYIRQIALKYKDDGHSRLSTVGIDIPLADYKKIRNTLSKLSIDAHICFKNRYWDPFDLEELYSTSKNLRLPLSINESGIAEKLKKIIIFMRDRFLLYSKRYFDVDDKFLQSYCISSERWLKEQPLCEILSGNYYDNSEKIENTINILNKISFGLPMLLKPLYDIKNQEAMFLRFLEMGVFRPFTRRMIELNIPRETAIMLSKQYFDENQFDEKNVDEYIKQRLNRISSDLSFWDQIQLESLVNLG